MGFAVLALAFVLLIPGITRPILILKGSVEKADLIELGKELVTTSPNIMPMIGSMAVKLMDTLDTEGEIPAYEKQRSILGTVGELFDSRHYFVGFLVMLFSVVIPVSKAALMVTATLAKKASWGPGLLRFSKLISKWSMADVFVIAIVVAFLAANASQDSGELFSLQAEFGSGFYFFLGYCLLSILSAQLLPDQVQDETDHKEH